MMCSLPESFQLDTILQIVDNFLLMTFQPIQNLISPPTTKAMTHIMSVFYMLQMITNGFIPNGLQMSQCLIIYMKGSICEGDIYVKILYISN